MEESDANRNRSPQARGSSAHAQLKKRIAGKLGKFNAILGRVDARMDYEVFFDEDHREVPIKDKRPKGSIGIDIAIFHPASARAPGQKPLLLIDLKTGRPWNQKERGRILNRLGVGGKGTVIEIMVNFRK